MLRRSIAQRAARPDLAQEEEDDTYDSGTGVSYADSGGQDRSTLPEELPLTEDQIASLWEQARSIVESDHPNEVETQDEIIAWLNVGVMGGQLWWDTNNVFEMDPLPAFVAGLIHFGWEEEQEEIDFVAASSCTDE